MAFLLILGAGMVVANVLYVGAALLQGSADPRFDGDKVIYRS